MWEGRFLAPPFSHTSLTSLGIPSSHFTKFEEVCRISFCLGGSAWKVLLRELRWIFVQLSPVQNSTLLWESCLQDKWIAQNCVILTQIFSKHHWSLFLSIIMVVELPAVMWCCHCTFVHACLKRNFLLLFCFLNRMKLNLTEFSFKMAWGKHQILKNLSRFKASFNSYSAQILPRQGSLEGWLLSLGSSK